METTILYVYGLWFWLTRKFRMESYVEAAEVLQAARAHLADDLAARASTRDRGHLLPHQIEALALLDQCSTLAARTALRLESLSECCHFVIEELTGSPAKTAPIALPSREAFTPVAVRTALIALMPDTRSGLARFNGGNSPALAVQAVHRIELPEAA